MCPAVDSLDTTRNPDLCKAQAGPECGQEFPILWRRMFYRLSSAQFVAYTLRSGIKESIPGRQDCPQQLDYYPNRNR